MRTEPLHRRLKTQRSRQRCGWHSPPRRGMSYIGHSGKVTGYNYDYLEKVSEYTGLEMDYVAYPSDDGNEAVGNAMNDLIEGKVDLMGPMLKTEQA